MLPTRTPWLRQTEYVTAAGGMKNILIAQPNTGTVVAGTVGYLMDLGAALSADGVPWSYRQVTFSDIALSRNIFASHVIADNVYSHVLYVDSDMGFAPETVKRMIAFDKPVVAAACPRRFLAWERLHQLALAEADRPTDQRRSTAELMDAALRYNVDTTTSDGLRWQAEMDGPFLKVPAIGTGLMLIHRDVFEIMLAREIARPRPGYRDLPLLAGAPLCDFFSTLEAPDGSLIESEDISFCRRWVEGCGGEIWADVESRILHYGIRGHAGRYLPRVTADFPGLVRKDGA